jgi:hypothetical protein
MWLELIIAPPKIELGKLLLWMENCGSYQTDEVEKAIAVIGLHMAFYPPNMTAILQMLDLVINGPLKAYVRNLRAWRIFEEFKRFKVIWAEENLKAPSERKLLKFEAPKPDMVESMHDLIKLFATEFMKEDFMSGIISSFQKTGSAPSLNLLTNCKEFTIYREVHCNGVKGGIAPEGTLSSNEIEDEYINEALQCFLDDDDDDNDVDDIADALGFLDDENSKNSKH